MKIFYLCTSIIDTEEEYLWLVDYTIKYQNVAEIEPMHLCKLLSETIGKDST